MATLTGCTLSDNYAPSYNGYNNGLSGFGAGVLNDGTATLTGCTVSGNSAIGDGGGVWNSGYASLTLTDCALSSNSGYDGGGVSTVGTANLTDCALSGNSAVLRGGGLFNGGMATLTGCTLSANNAAYGGGLENNIATANLTDCTVSGNASEFGGGVFNYTGTANLTNCTLSGNDASGGGGGLANYNNGNIPAGPATLTDTIVAGNTSLSGAGDIGGTNVSGSDNLIGTGGSAGLVDGVDGNIVGVANPLLAPLGNYGGPTQTMALLPGSPAIGTGVAVTGVTTDQRGEPLDSPEPDIGAFQSQGFTFTPVAGSTPQSAATGTPFAAPLAVTVAANNPVEPVAGGISTFTAPANGPSANLSATTATISHNGVASVTAAANGSVGSYAVTASAGGNGTDFDLTNTTGTLISLAFSGISDQTILYGTTGVTISGTLANGSQAPAGETVAVTLASVEQSATIGSGGAFSTTFNTADLAVAGSPYTLTYAYASDGTFASANTTSTLTVKSATPTIFTVNSLGDAGIGSGDAGDLLYCINQANSDDQPNTIVFDPSVFGTPQTITLSGGQLELKDTLGTQTITGPAAGVTISGGGNSRVFQVDPGVTASISGLTISGGSAAGIGGGLVNYGTTTLTDCTLSGNTVVNSSSNFTLQGEGGAVFNGQTAPNYYGKSYGAANLTLTDCTLRGNAANGGGGGGGVFNAGTANLTDCTISGNSAEREGGGAVQCCRYGQPDSDRLHHQRQLSFYGGGGLANVGGTITLNQLHRQRQRPSASSNSSGGGGVYNFSGTAIPDGLHRQRQLRLLRRRHLERRHGLPDRHHRRRQHRSLRRQRHRLWRRLGQQQPARYRRLGRAGQWGRRQHRLDQPHRPGPGPAGQQRRPDPDHGPAPRQPSHRRGCDRRLPGHHHSDHHRSARRAARLTQSRHRRLPDPRFHTHLAELLGNQRPEHHLRHLQRDHFRYAGQWLAGPGGRDRRRDARQCRAVGHHRLRRRLLHHLRHHRPHRRRLALHDHLRLYQRRDLRLRQHHQHADGQPGDAHHHGGPRDQGLRHRRPGARLHRQRLPVQRHRRDGPDRALARAQAGTLAGEQAGGYAITQGTLAADSNYTIAFTGSTLTITPAPLTVTANSQTKVYGTPIPALTDTATGFVDTTVDGVTIDDTAASALTGKLARAQFGTFAGEQVGDYAISQGTLAANSNYTISFTGNTLTITPATLTVSADPQTKVYGTNDPSLSDTATGFIDTTVDGVTIADTAATVLSGDLSGRRAGRWPARTAYAISQGTLAANGDYSMSFTGSTLTITLATLTVTANPQTKVYGVEDPALTDSAAGFVDTTVDGVAIADTAATVLSGTLARRSRAALAGEQVGDYAISQGTLAADSNYTISFTGNTLTITPATLTVFANPQTKVYGTDDPSLTDTATGFINTTVDGVAIADTAATVLSGDLSRAAGETVAGGPYAITQGTLAADSNYTIAFTGSSLSITAATPMLTVTDPGGTYTGTPIAATASVTGALGTVAASLEGVTPTLTYYAGSGTSGANLGSAAPSAAGTYTVVARFPGSADYTPAQFKPNQVFKQPLTIAYSGDPDSLAGMMSPPQLTKSGIASSRI